MKDINNECLISERRIEEQFFASMRDCNIKPRDEYLPLVMDGEIHYFDVQDKRAGNKNGRYYIRANGWPSWGIMDYCQHTGMQQFKFDIAKLDNDERKDFLKRFFLEDNDEYHSQVQVRNKKAEDANAVKEKERKQTVIHAWNEYDSATDITNVNMHPYLMSKHVENVNRVFFQGHFLARLKMRYESGDICRKGELLLPIVSADTGEFRSLQHFFSRPNEDGFFPRPFYTGTSYTGCCCELIPYHCRTWHDPRPEPLFTPIKSIFPRDNRAAPLDADKTFICEGFATGLAVLELTDHKYPVLCALSCNNILNVAKAWKLRYPQMKIIIAADNDVAGLKATEDTIQAGYADGKIIPPIQGMDWNDYMNSKGENS